MCRVRSIPDLPVHSACGGARQKERSVIVRECVMASRGRRRGFSGGYRRREEQNPVADVLLDSEQVEGVDKTIAIEMKSNSQGKFVKITETRPGVQRSGAVVRISIETCSALRTLLNEFVAEYERLAPMTEDVTGSQNIKSDSFLGYKSKRKYFVDLRENANGRFLKLSVIADGKKFVAVPGEAIVEFRDKFAKLLDKHPITEPASPSASSLPPPKSLQVDRKTFYFDVDKNDRGVFVKVSEVLANGYRPGHINVPHSSWEKVAEVFSALAKELPYTEESSGSDES